MNSRELIALVVLGAVAWVKLSGGNSPLPTPAGPEVRELRNTGLTKTDALKIATYVEAYGNLIYEDGQREDE